MADPEGCHDPFESSITDEIFNTFNNQDLTFSDLSLTEEPFMQQPSSVPQSNVNIGDANNNPFDDPFLWDNINSFNGANSQVDPSLEMNNPERLENDNYGDMRPLLVWPVQPVPYLCSCCLVLREIIHTNGNDTTKLEIHGRLGMICHAILEIRQSTNVNQHQMFDFCKRSIEDVKNFLVQYCEERKQTGFFLLPDPLSIFYDALCVGLDSAGTLTTDDYTQLPLTNSEFFQGTNALEVQNETNTLEVQNESDRILSRTPLSIQRERTGKLSLSDLVQVFHLPIEDAAKRMKLCPTVMKRICRKGGLLRWPHRKLKSIEKKISNLTAKLGSNDARERANAQAQIERLQDQMIEICTPGIPR